MDSETIVSLAESAYDFTTDQMGNAENLLDILKDQAPGTDELSSLIKKTGVSNLPYATKMGVAVVGYMGGDIRSEEEENAIKAFVTHIGREINQEFDQTDNREASWRIMKQFVNLEQSRQQEIIDDFKSIAPQEYDLVENTIDKLEEIESVEDKVASEGGPDFRVLDNPELQRTSELIGIQKQAGRKLLVRKILDEVNADGRDWIELYREACEHIDIEWEKSWSKSELKEELYSKVTEKIEDSIEKMDADEKEALEKEIEEKLDDQTLDTLKKSRAFSAKTKAMGTGVLALQGGAVALTGSNLGICLLLTEGIAGLSGLIGVTFPFAVYAGASTVGGYILTAAGVIASGPVVAATAGLGIAYYGYSFYKKETKKPLVKLININYIIQSRKKYREEL